MFVVGRLFRKQVEHVIQYSRGNCCCFCCKAEALKQDEHIEQLFCNGVHAGAGKIWSLKYQAVPEDSGTIYQACVSVPLEQVELVL